MHSKKIKTSLPHTILNIRPDILIGCLLVVATLLAYGEIGTFEFVRYDDPDYVSRNPQVQAGMTLDGITWAFTSTEVSNWHPLTWLSHMLDVKLWGLNPGGHHLTSLLLHIINTQLLFYLLYTGTRNVWQSGCVAALFALHPLHVESVAWVAERKDVLSTLFWLLTMGAYARYAKQSSIWKYLPVLGLFALGLMAKPMLVTLPLVLLLMDHWPLNRLACLPLSKLVIEKIPMFIIAGVSSTITVIVQHQGGAMNSLDVYPVSVRVANALVAYAHYIGNTLLPVRLAVLYPHPGMPPKWQVAGALALLAGITWWVVLKRKKYPYLIVGWLWYLGTLVPVIGLVQVGMQSMADRYTYVPLIGLFIAGTWGIADLFRNFSRKHATLALLALVIFPLLTMATRRQAGHWRNSLTLFGHALKVTTGNYVAHNNMGNALAIRGNLDEAIRHFSAAIKIIPGNHRSLNNLGAAFMLKGENEKAAHLFNKALEIRPDYPDALRNLKRVQTKMAGGEYRPPPN